MWRNVSQALNSNFQRVLKRRFAIRRCSRLVARSLDQLLEMLRMLARIAGQLGHLFQERLFENYKFKIKINTIPTIAN
jgi:hypothetical protein